VNVLIQARTFLDMFETRTPLLFDDSALLARLRVLAPARASGADFAAVRTGQALLDRDS